VDTEGLESMVQARPHGQRQRFEAGKEKHRLTVLYRHSKGKEKKQVYQLVVAAADSQPHAPAS